MNQETFETQYQHEWDEFEALVAGIRAKKGVHGEDLFAFPRRYRRLCKHLALARDRCYSMVIVDRLNNLVLQGHHLMYLARGGSWAIFAHFIWVQFPQAVRREARLVGLCSLLFYGPLLGIVLALYHWPELVYSILSPDQVDQYEQMYGQPTGLSRPSSSDVQMFGYYIMNNVGIGFRTFASGILAGVGSIFFLVLNGLMIGTVMGHMVHMPFHETFFTFVVGHGAFELTAIVLSGTAGLRLGLALIFPGQLSRREAVKKAAQTGLTIVYGMAGMLVLAAMVEAFWSPRVLPPELKYSVGAGFWILTLLYFTLCGRGHEHP